MSLPRLVLPNSSYLITRRCLLRFFLLRPSKTTNQILRFALACAAAKYQIELHAFCVMSNHVHIVLTDPHAQLPKFMHWFCEFVAKCINTQYKRSEFVWAPDSYSAQQLASPEDLLAKMVYTITNPVSAALVRSAKDWPGVISRPQESGAAGCQVARPTIFFRKNGKVPAMQTLSLRQPQSFDSYANSDFVELLAKAVKQREIQIRQELRKQKRSFLGAKQILAQSPFTQPRSTETQPRINPRVAGRDRSLRLVLLHRFKAFLQAYRQALDSYRLGKRTIRFPTGTYWMRVQFGVECCTTP